MGIRQNEKKGFTLIELLVVISIIALLLSILLPSLKAVKERAKRVVCLAHTRGVGTALLTLIINDNEGKLPRQPFETVSGGKKYYSFGDSGSSYYAYYQKSHKPEVRGSAGAGYLVSEGYIDKESDLFFCPSFKNVFGEPKPSKNWNSGGDNTHWNYCGPGHVPPPGSTLQELRDEDAYLEWVNLRWTLGWRGFRKAFNISSIEQAKSRGKLAFISDLWAAQQGPYWRTKRSDINHRSGNSRAMNIWYLDGHTESVKMQDDWFEGKEEDSLLKADMTWSDMFD